MATGSSNPCCSRVRSTYQSDRTRSVTAFCNPMPLISPLPLVTFPPFHRTSSVTFASNHSPLPHQTVANSWSKAMLCWYFYSWCLDCTLNKRLSIDEWVSASLRQIALFMVLHIASKTNISGVLDQIGVQTGEYRFHIQAHWPPHHILLSGL